MLREKQNTGKRSLFPDLVLIAALLLLSGAFLLAFALFGKPGSAVRVVENGVTVGEYPLSVDRKVPLCGGGNLLVIEGGAAHIESATCPDRLCEKQGKISRAGERLICLPHRLSVEVIGKKGGAPDLVAFRLQNAEKFRLPGGAEE